MAGADLKSDKRTSSTVISMFRHRPDFDRKEVGFLEQRQLFDRLADLAGEAPPVIDSDDLLEDPRGIVGAYCNVVGIAYMPEALTAK